MMRCGVLVVLLTIVCAVRADDLQRAQQLAWDKQFAASEALYREILAREPQSAAARLALARVVMWQGRYAEAIARFEALEGIEALEGRATAEYWSGDLRAAARDFRRVLALDPNRELAARSLAEIASVATPSQRLSVQGAHDDQPLDAIRTEVAATFYSDPLTRWTVSAQRYHLDADRFALTADGEALSLANETRLGAFTFHASAGVFTYPDDTRRAIGSASVRYRRFLVGVERRPELASATSLRTHASSTTTTLRWDYDGSLLDKLVAAVDVSHRRYFDGNEGRAAVAYAVVPWKHGHWTFWGGASATARDTDQSRFRITAVSATLDQGFFRYEYRGEYDPYWTPDDLLEARAVVAVERRLRRGSVKLHGDAGYARDRGRVFGPGAGATPFPPQTFAFAFDRDYRPWRAGLTANVRLTGTLHLEAGVERGATVDYRSTSFHAALVRRR